MHFHSNDDFVNHRLAAVLLTQPLTFASHRLATGVKRLTQDRLIRIHKFLPLPHDLFERFSCAACQIQQIAFCTPGIATQLLARLASGLGSQQYCRHCT